MSFKNALAQEWGFFILLILLLLATSVLIALIIPPPIQKFLFSDYVLALTLIIGLPILLAGVATIARALLSIAGYRIKNF